MNIKRSRYANCHKITFAHTRKIRRRLNCPIANELLQILVNNVTDVVLSSVNHINFFGLHVKA